VKLCIISFSAFLLLPPSHVQKFSSAPCSQSPSLYSHPLILETKFHTHAKSGKVRLNLFDTSRLWI
jgi:hypothetical protein